MKFSNSMDMFESQDWEQCPQKRNSFEQAVKLSVLVMRNSPFCRFGFLLLKNEWNEMKSMGKVDLVEQSSGTRRWKLIHIRLVAQFIIMENKSELNEGIIPFSIRSLISVFTRLKCFYSLISNIWYFKIQNSQINLSNLSFIASKMMPLIQ